MPLINTLHEAYWENRSGIFGR